MKTLFDGITEKLNILKGLGELHEEASKPKPLMLDEVAASWISMTKVNCWETLGTEYGGYKVGKILSYILEVLNEKIIESTSPVFKASAIKEEQE